MRAYIVLALAGCGRIGFDALGDAEPPTIDKPEIARMPSIALTDSDSCVVRTDDSLWCWGGNYDGENGVGDLIEHDSPLRVAPERAWRRVVAGSLRVCALDADAAVYCWGSNGNGGLGVGDYDDRYVPTRVTVHGSAIAIATGEDNSQAITASGVRWAWGDNRNRGALGIGTDFGPVLLPVVALGQDWAMLATGVYIGCGITTAQALWCWGATLVGTGDPDPHFSPVEIEPGSKWQSVTAYLQTCAIRDDGALYCWGDDTFGAIGDGGTADVASPKSIAPGSTWSLIAAGLQTTCGIRTDGSLWCWGHNNVGQLGLGDVVDRGVPTEVAPGTRWQTVAVSQFWSHTCGIQTDDSMWCWGSGAEGALGQGNLANHRTPVRVPLP